MKKNDYIIRLENPCDYRTVETITREAFWNLSVPGCDEHYYVHVMRSHADFIPELEMKSERRNQFSLLDRFVSYPNISERAMARHFWSILLRKHWSWVMTRL